MKDYALVKYIDNKSISEKVSELSEKINNDFKDADSLLFIGVLKGAWMFLADIVRNVNLSLDISFIAVSSYLDKTETSGVVRILWDVDVPLAGKDVFLIEDIVDSGLTLKHLKELFYVRDPKSINVCCLLDKPSKRLVDIDIDYVGFTIPDYFVVGYGMDYAGKHRNLKDIYRLEFNK
ncbi:MAG: hypoxanthine phosphoribosyltransferase [Deferribacterota bacterium]|nr:hypoxanthine phosphoribosyltransferase [Deferribacterota bacterium]